MYRKALRIINAFLGVAYVACVVLGIVDYDSKMFIFGMLGAIACLANVVFMRREF